MLRPLLIAAALIVAVAGGAILFAWSGIFNVAASSGHPAPVAWLLHFTMTNSVRTHAYGIEPPGDLDRADRIARGAAHFDLGCAPCHGAPAAARNVIVTEMVPPPPVLETKISAWRPRELFWIVKHGIKYAGMPAWPAQNRDDEVWDVTAFLLELPGMDPGRYRQLARGPTKESGDQQGSSGDGAAETRPAGKDDLDDARRNGTGDRAAMEPVPLNRFVGEGRSPSIATCARCHGYNGTGRDGAFPKLAGHPEGYLVATLRDYAEGRRHSGIMQPIAAKLEPSDIARLAAQYARFERSAAAAPAIPGGSRIDLEQARTLAQFGDVDRGIPACSACHGTPRPQPNMREAGASPPTGFPSLHGQPASFLSTQLRLFEAGHRGGRRAHVMRMIAGRLDDREMASLAAYYASLAPGADDSGPADPGASARTSRHNASAAPR